MGGSHRVWAEHTGWYDRLHAPVYRRHSVYHNHTCVLTNDRGAGFMGVSKSGTMHHSKLPEAGKRHTPEYCVWHWAFVAMSITGESRADHSRSAWRVPFEEWDLNAVREGALGLISVAVTLDPKAPCWQHMPTEYWPDIEEEEALSDEDKTQSEDADSSNKSKKSEDGCESDEETLAEKLAREQKAKHAADKKAQEEQKKQKERAEATAKKKKAEAEKRAREAAAKKALADAEKAKKARAAKQHGKGAPTDQGKHQRTLEDTMQVRIQ